MVPQVLGVRGEEDLDYFGCSGGFGFLQQKNQAKKN